MSNIQQNSAQKQFPRGNSFRIAQKNDRFLSLQIRKHLARTNMHASRIANALHKDESIIRD